jgi:hypothetical protein
MRVLIIFICLLALTACGQKSGKVKLELTSSFSVSGNSAFGNKAAGGLMVWGMSKDGDSFSRVLSDSSNIELDLPNGEWTFTAVAWESSNDTLLDKDKLRCARSAQMKLEGKDVEVNLEMEEANCANASFRGGSSIAPPNLNLNLCQNALAVGVAGDKCTNDSLPASNRKSDKAPVRSVRVRMMEFDKFGKTVVETGPGLSRCINMPDSTSGLWITPPDLAIPVGDPAKPGENPFRMELEFHWSILGCNGVSALDFGVTQLPLGLVSPGHKFFVDDSSNHVSFINVSDKLVCNGRENETTFFNGDGSRAHPFVICNVAQLQKIHEDPTPTESYRLAADIDLTASTKGLAGAVLPPNAATCWELGQTWQPIGYSLNPNCTRNTSNFNGSFHGGGHTIKNMRTRYENNFSVGFIGVWDPNENDSGIRELTLRDIEVSGLYQVGGLLGYKGPARLGTINDIRIDNARIQARRPPNANGTFPEAFVGGAIGHVNYVNLSNIRVDNTIVRAEVSKVGGIFGQVNNALVLRNIFSHAIVGSSGGSFHGGVAGAVEWVGDGADYEVIRHEGAVISGGDNVGGLFGFFNLDVNATVNDMYATSAIHVFKTGTTPNIGGLFGNTTFRNYHNMYFAGAITIKGTPSNTGLIVGNPSACPTTGCTRSNVFYIGPTPGYGHGNGISNPIVPINRTNELSQDIFTDTTILNSAPWEHAPNSLPRFIDEDHPCALPSNLLALGSQSGRGDAANPYAVCRKDQLAAVDGLTTGNVRLMAPINMSGAFTPPIIKAGVTLDGADKVLFGYNITSIAADTMRAPFVSNAGLLKNLSLANMLLTVGNPGSGSAHVAGLVSTNTGTIDGVDYLSGIISHTSTTFVQAAGLVSSNTATGKIRNVKFFGDLGGRANFSGLVTTNAGLIEDSVVGGSLFSPVSMATSGVAGIAATNTGTIQRVSVESRFIHDYAVGSMSMGVLVNGTNGLVSDVLIDSQAEWKVAGFDPSVGVIAVNNDAGTIRRVLIKGRLLDTDNSVDTIFGASRGRTVPAANTTYSGVYTQFPAGRLIYSGNETNVSCVSNNLTIGGALPSPFANGAAYWVTNLTIAGQQKYVWVIAEKNGLIVVQRALGRVADSFLKLALPSSCSDYVIAGTNVYIVQSYANDSIFDEDDVLQDNFSGVVSKAFLVPANLGIGPTFSPWRANVLDEASAPNTILNYFLSVLAGNNPVKPAPWVIENGSDLRLLDSN